MGKIATYPIVTPQGDDKIIVSQTTGSPQDATKNITVDGLASYVGTANGIPTPEMFVIKRKFVDGVSPNEDWGLNHQLCIRGLVGADKSWLDPTKEARLFMYTKKPNKVTTDYAAIYPKRKGGWTHPSHLNGTYTTARFGNTNWGNGGQEGIDEATGNIVEYPDIVTEWNIATELKILATGATADFSDPTLRQTTYIQVPFNQCQFLVEEALTPTPITDLNYPIGIDLAKNKVRNAVRPTVNSINGAFNTNTPWDAGGDVRVSNKIVMRFVIGIVNPDFTLTNHTVPYIFGQPSEPVTLVYQSTGSSFVQKCVIAVGHAPQISRRV